MRITQHSGRIGYAKHNDRDFDISKAGHINTDRTQDNIYRCIYRDMSFEDAERKYYADHYTDALEKKNARYQHEGHADRCRTIDQIYKSKQYQPEEIILQLGDKSTHMDAEVFTAALTDYLHALADWNEEHGNHMHILDYAVHLDETSPHAHIRRVWDYKDRDGLLQIGQNKALEMAGIGLPDPTKPRGRYNNRKISFDDMMRDKWVEIAETYHIDVDKTPVPDAHHQDKEDYIRQQIAETMARNAELMQQVDLLERKSAKLRDDNAILATRNAILSATQVQDTTRSTKTPLLHRDKVMIDRTDYDALLKTAQAAQAAKAETETMAAEQREAMSKAHRIIADARQQAAAMQQASQKESLDQIVARQQIKMDLDMYKRLEALYPDVFVQMRSAIQQHEQQHHEYGIEL